jgi:succinate dehydrogenase / fumarate reductase cytochrome b subunit
MMVIGFQQWPVSIFYLIGVGLLCLHLSHGISAMFQSLGWKKRFLRRVPGSRRQMGRRADFPGL